jgi:hypothetical protein
MKCNARKGKEVSRNVSISSDVSSNSANNSLGRRQILVRIEIWVKFCASAGTNDHQKHEIWILFMALLGLFLEGRK